MLREKTIILCDLPPGPLPARRLPTRRLTGRRVGPPYGPEAESSARDKKVILTTDAHRPTRTLGLRPLEVRGWRQKIKDQIWEHMCFRLRSLTYNHFGLSMHDMKTSSLTIRLDKDLSDLLMQVLGIILSSANLLGFADSTKIAGK